MLPRFWKHSHGKNFFSEQQFSSAMRDKRIYIDKNTNALGMTNVSQGELFISASIGDYFYLTHGGSLIYLLGQISGPVDYFVDKKNRNNEAGWISRPYEVIRSSKPPMAYEHNFQKWWTPNHNSTFCAIPEDCLQLFEEFILAPHFDIEFSYFNIEIPHNQKTLNDDYDESSEFL